jgi:hypothetical protein
VDSPWYFIQQNDLQSRHRKIIGLALDTILRLQKNDTKNDKYLTQMWPMLVEETCLSRSVAGFQVSINFITNTFHSSATEKIELTIHLPRKLTPKM